MSKWVNTDKFEQFKNERANDTSDVKTDITYARKYPNPKMGTINKPKEYHIRLLPDLKGNFYKKMYYHMFQSGEVGISLCVLKQRTSNVIALGVH